MLFLPHGLALCQFLKLLKTDEAGYRQLRSGVCQRDRDSALLWPSSLRRVSPAENEQSKATWANAAPRLVTAILLARRCLIANTRSGSRRKTGTDPNSKSHRAVSIGCWIVTASPVRGNFEHETCDTPSHTAGSVIPFPLQFYERVYKRSTTG